MEYIRLNSEREQARVTYHERDREIQHLLNTVSAREREALLAIQSSLAIAAPPVPTLENLESKAQNKKATEALNAEDSLALLQAKEEKPAKKQKTEAQKIKAKLKREKLLIKKAEKLLRKSPSGDASDASFSA